MNVISCKDARAQGLKRYFTGRPCKHGHIDERHVTGGCVECSKLDQKKYYHQNPEKYMAATVAYRELNREKTNAIQRRYYANNAETIKAEQSLIRAVRMQRVPAWSEIELIAEFYANCPDGYEVDHYYPLQGETVSGLHVFGNLQYLTRAENRAKKNKFPEE